MKGILIVAGGALLAAVAMAGPAAAEVSDRSNVCYYGVEGSGSWLHVTHKSVFTGMKEFEACKSTVHHDHDDDDDDDNGWDWDD